MSVGTITQKVEEGQDMAKIWIYYWSKRNQLAFEHPHTVGLAMYPTPFHLERPDLARYVIFAGVVFRVSTATHMRLRLVCSAVVEGMRSTNFESF